MGLGLGGDFEWNGVECISEIMNCTVLPTAVLLFLTCLPIENHLRTAQPPHFHFFKHAVIPATAANVPSGFLTETVSIPICFAG